MSPRYNDPRDFIAQLEDTDIRVFRCAPEDVDHPANIPIQVAKLSFDLNQRECDTNDFSFGELKEIFQEKRGFYGVNEQDNLVAFSEFEFHEITNPLLIPTGLMVHPDFQNQKIGSKFLEAWNRILFRGEEFSDFDILIMTTNEKIRHFYQNKHLTNSHHKQELDLDYLWEKYAYDVIDDAQDWSNWTVESGAGRSLLELRNVRRICNPNNDSPEMGILFERKFPGRNIPSASLPKKNALTQE